MRISAVIIAMFLMFGQAHAQQAPSSNMVTKQVVINYTGTGVILIGARVGRVMLKVNCGGYIPNYIYFGMYTSVTPSTGFLYSPDWGASNGAAGAMSFPGYQGQL